MSTSILGTWNVWWKNEHFATWDVLQKSSFAPKKAKMTQHQPRMIPEIKCYIPEDENQGGWPNHFWIPKKKSPPEKVIGFSSFQWFQPASRGGEDVIQMMDREQLRTTDFHTTQSVYWPTWRFSFFNGRCRYITYITYMDLKWAIQYTVKEHHFT